MLPSRGGSGASFGSRCCALRFPVVGDPCVGSALGHLTCLSYCFLTIKVHFAFLDQKKSARHARFSTNPKKSLHGILGFPGTLFWAPAGGSDAGVRAWCKVYVSFNAESGLCIVKIQSKSTPVAAECGHKKASWRPGLGVTLAGAQTKSQTLSWALWGLV